MAVKQVFINTSMINTDLIFTIITGAFVGLASGYLGSFMILRRMSLVGDALSHVALPGLALGLLWHLNPFVGAFAALFLGILAIWIIENKTKLPTETLVGIFFTFSLAVGLLLIQDEGVLEAIFGDISKINIVDSIFAIIIALVSFIIIKKISKKLILATISKDLANAEGVNTEKIDFIFLLMISLVVALGIKIIGVLLMGALVIIPAAAAKNSSNRLNPFTQLATVFGAISAVVGIIISNFYHLPPGPIVVLTGIGLFFISLFARK